MVRRFLTDHGYHFILGDGGYYAFVNVGQWMDAANMTDSFALIEHLAAEYGIAVVPGVAFSDEGESLDSLLVCAAAGDHAAGAGTFPRRADGVGVALCGEAALDALNAGQNRNPRFSRPTNTDISGDKCDRGVTLRPTI